MRWGTRSDRHGTTTTRRPPPRDEVSGLLTYAALVHDCTDALTAAVAPGVSAEPALLLVELDGLRELAVTDGQAAADEAMALMASRITREVGSLGPVARMSEVGVGVLFAHLPEPAVALDLAYRLVSAISSAGELSSGRRVQLSSSCGLVTRTTFGATASVTEMLRGAGLAVLEARRLDRNVIEVCTPELVALADETLAIGKDLRLALREKGLGVCYQPLVDLGDGGIVGFEALVRWTHPVHGPMSPSRFVPVAEQFGLLSELGRMVLSTATAQVQQWSVDYDLPLAAHINVSGADLVSDDFIAMTVECLEESGLPPERLVVEVTEGGVAPDLDAARSRFEALRGLGARIAMDDYTTGHSSLAYMESLTLDILKVDRYYLDLTAAEPADNPHDMLRGVIGFGHAMGMEVYAEGIETDDERQRLFDYGCRVGQGYHFARPLPAVEAAAMLRDQVEPPDTLARRLAAAEASARQ
jgi:predicted signal transduction protein with EAL and GGDEF domain